MQELPNSPAEDSVIKGCITGRFTHKEPFIKEVDWKDSINDRRSCGCPLDYHLSDCPILTSTRLENYG